MNERTNQLRSIFFIRKSSQEVLKVNYELLIIDAIYKTNKYKLPLFIITGITTLNTLFYIGFAFIPSEYTEDYQ